MLEAISPTRSAHRRSTFQRSERDSNAMDIENNASSQQVDIERASTPTPPQDDIERVTTPSPPQDDAQSMQSSSRMRFEPIDDPEGYTPLTFLPKLLTGWVLWSLVSFYTILSVLLAYLFYCSEHGYHWTIHDVNYYLATRYLPTVVGVISWTLHDSSISTLRKMVPFMSMADQPMDDPDLRSVGITDSHRLPDLLFFFDVLGGLVMALLVSLKSILFSVQENNDNAWMVSVRALPAICLSGSYLAIALMTAYVALKYANCRTGLKKDWEPTSLADIVLLFSTEDTKPKLDFPLDEKAHLKMWAESGRAYRLGYWRIHYLETSRSNIVYGIRSYDRIRPVDDTIELSQADTHLNNFEAFFNLQGSLKPYFHRLVDQGYTKEPGLARTPTSATHDLLPTHCCTETPTCSHYPYRKAPYLKVRFMHVFALLMLLLLCVGLICVLIRIWTAEGIIFQISQYPSLSVQSNDVAVVVNNASYTLSAGNLWVDLPSHTNPSPWGWTYILSLICMFRLFPVGTIYVANWAISRLDEHHRWTQPYVNMYTEASSASQSLLLDYMTVSPLTVLPEAWGNGHYKVIYFGILNSFSWIPILIVTGLGSIMVTDRTIVQISPILTFFAVIWSFLYIHALTSWSAPPKRKLPRSISNYNDLLCFFYDSKFRWRPEFGHAAFSPDLTKDELHTLIRLSRDKYLFGLVGEPGEEHPGFDVAETSDGTDTDYVRWIKPLPGFFDRVKSMFRRRKNKSERGDDDSDPEGILLNHLDASSSTSNRRDLAAEVTPPQGHSTALDVESS